MPTFVSTGRGRAVGCITPEKLVKLVRTRYRPRSPMTLSVGLGIDSNHKFPINISLTNHLHVATGSLKPPYLQHAPYGCVYVTVYHWVVKEVLRWLITLVVNPMFRLQNEVMMWESVRGRKVLSRERVCKDVHSIVIFLSYFLKLQNFLTT